MENIIEVLQEIKNTIQQFHFWAYISKGNNIITLNIYICAPLFIAGLHIPAKIWKRAGFIYR